MFPGVIGLERVRSLLKDLNNPQDKLKVIHVAGTSGKGSTSFFLSTILRSLGFNVGLSVSPHLLDVRERFQINNKLLTEDKFCDYLNQIIPAIETVSRTKYGSPTYFEVLIALAYYIFRKEGVDYAVIETGLGGTYDATNIVTRRDKIVVITNIGHDHTNVLGKTLSKIAFQKAGIIQLYNDVVTTRQCRRVMEVINEVSLEKKSKLYVVGQSAIKEMSLVSGTLFDFSFLGIAIKNVQLRMLGSFQVQNSSLALSTVVLLSERDKFIFDIEKIRQALKKALFVGRMQRILINNRTLIIDCAHNPQKMSMFTKNLATYFPNQKFTFVIAFKRGKDYRNILRYIIPLAKDIIVTSFFDQTESQGLSTLAEDTGVISRILDGLNFKNYVVCKDGKEALMLLLQDKKAEGVITGSLFLISELYPLLEKKAV